MKDLHIDLEFRGNIQLIRLQGVLDMYSAPRLESQLQTLFQQGRYCVVIECSQLDFIGSTVLGILIGFAKQARDHDGDLKLLRVPERIYKIIELLGFTKVLQVYTTEEIARASFQKP